jgi:hypothetical protein
MLVSVRRLLTSMLSLTGVFLLFVLCLVPSAQDARATQRHARWIAPVLTVTGSSNAMVAKSHICAKLMCVFAPPHRSLRRNLGSSQLTGSISSEIGQLTELTLLYVVVLTIPVPSSRFLLSDNRQLFGNQLTGPIPSTIGQLKVLKQLYLHSNQLTGPIPSTIGQLTALMFLCDGT